MGLCGKQETYIACGIETRVCVVLLMMTTQRRDVNDYGNNTLNDVDDYGVGLHMCV